MCIYMYVCCVFAGLYNKMYKIHRTYIKIVEVCKQDYKMYKEWDSLKTKQMNRNM
jgi:hypothetical protein